MIALVIGLVAGFLAARLVWLGARPSFSAFLRPNHRDRLLPTAAGTVIPVAVLLVEGVRATAAAFGVGPSAGIDGARALTLATVVGFGLLGLLDDVAGSNDHRGFRGHLSALGSGTFTTGVLKLGGGAALALAVVAPLPSGSAAGGLFRDAALVALAANLGNLLDLAPGRVLKASGLAFAVLAIGTRADPHLVGTGVVVGSGIGLMPEDLRERLMLGDAGANALGATLGLATVLAVSPGTRLAVLIALGGLNLAGEVVSFSRVIAAVPPLRAADEAFRR